MTTDYVDNPAGRLAAIFTDVRKSSPNESARAVWARALTAEDDESLFSRLADLIDLIRATKTAIEALPAEEIHDFYLRPFALLDALPPKLLAGVGHAKIEIYYPCVTPEVITTLEYTSLTLRRIGRYPSIEPEGVGSLLGIVREAITEALQHEALPRDAKLYIIKLLRDVEAALIGYRVGGFESVAAATAAVSAGIMVMPDDVQRGWLMSVLTKLWGGLNKHSNNVSAIAGSAQAVVGALESAKKLLS